MKLTTPLLKIHLRSTGPDGEELRTETWASWPNFTEEGVLARWKRENPALAAHYHSHEVVTPARRELETDAIAPLPAPRPKVYRKWREGRPSLMAL